MVEKIKVFDEKLEQFGKALIELSISYRELPSDVKSSIGIDFEEFSTDTFNIISDIDNGMADYITKNKSPYISKSMIKKARMIGSGNKILNKIASLDKDE